MTMRCAAKYSIWALSIVVAANSAQAQDKAPKAPEKPVEKTDDAARILFDAGAKAYAAGLFSDAVIAFREAHALAPDRPTVLFSLAQAERRQYTVKQEPAMLEAAIGHFRKYLEIVTEGGRRADVVIALGELEALRAGTESPVKKAARVFITTETPAAVISIDGKKRDQVPVIEEAPPGKHEVKIEAPGFISETREIVAVEGTIFPLEINLKEKPSFLAVKAPKGATISVDGRVYGDAPLSAPLEIASGTHLILVTQRGYLPHEEKISIERAWTSGLNIQLNPTNQRRASYFMFGSSMAGFGLGAGLLIASIAKDNEAAQIYKQTESGNLTRDMLNKYRSALGTRNDLILATVLADFAAVSLGVAAGFTYLFDSSSRLPTNTRRNDARISVTPLVGGGFVSVGLGF